MNCKRCELWKLLLIVATVAVLVMGSILSAKATHDPSSKRLDFLPIAENHLAKAANGRWMRAEALRHCPRKVLEVQFCTWSVTFFAKNPDGTEEEIAYATFSTDPETTALGCLLRYSTTKQVKDPDSGQMRNEILVERFFSETTCAKEADAPEHAY